MKAQMISKYALNVIAISIAFAATASFVACSDDATVKPKPVVVPDAGAVDGGTVTDTGAEGGSKECTDFATENERLLNAPTDSVAIKKKVVLPTGQ